MPLRRAVGHAYLYGVAASIGQYYWLVFDKVEGLWAIVLAGLAGICALIGLVYLAAGLLFRVAARFLPRGVVLIFPAIWVLIDYFRTLGELAFPWAFLGYSLTPILPLAQLASVTGVWGLTFLLVCGNVIVYQLLRKIKRGERLIMSAWHTGLFVATLILMTLAGVYRLGHHTQKIPEKKISLLQTNMDQFNWGSRSIDTAFTVTGAMVAAAAAERPALMVLPESALLCFVTRHKTYAETVKNWTRTTRVPLLFGALDWEQPESNSPYEYFVYNSAFLADTAETFRVYHKINLVPFSEGMPFEARFPILSRVNLGEADFQRGSDETVFDIGPVRAAPFICYEGNFPDFVRHRVVRGANLLVVMTNDGWFGRSSGPYHHAMMARMRSIENGVSLARCANSGLSMFVDPVGRLIATTSLYTRETLTRTVPIYKAPTLYTKFGDWFVALCGIIVLIGLVIARIRKNGVVMAVLVLMLFISGAVTAADAPAASPIPLEGSAPRKPKLSFNYETRTLVIHLDRASRVTISAFILKGQAVNKLSIEKFLASGTHTISFNSQQLADGVVVFKVEGSGFSASKTINLAR